MKATVFLVSFTFPPISLDLIFHSSFSVSLIVCSLCVTGSGNHLNVTSTLSVLRQSVFWGGMTSDVVMYVAKCCHRHEESPIMHHHPGVEVRVKRLEKYYKWQVRYRLY